MRRPGGGGPRGALLYACAVATSPKSKTARPKRAQGTKSAKSATAKSPTATKRATKQAVRSAAARAVEQVMNSKEAFALMMRRLEQAGWQVERAPGEHPRTADAERA